MSRLLWTMWRALAGLAVLVFVVNYRYLSSLPERRPPAPVLRPKTLTKAGRLTQFDKFTENGQRRPRICVLGAIKSDSNHTNIINRVPLWSFWSGLTSMPQVTGCSQSALTLLDIPMSCPVMMPSPDDTPILTKLFSSLTTSRRVGVDCEYFAVSTDVSVFSSVFEDETLIDRLKDHLAANKSAVTLLLTNSAPLPEPRFSDVLQSVPVIHASALDYFVGNGLWTEDVSVPHWNVSKPIDGPFSAVFVNGGRAGPASASHFTQVAEVYRIQRHFMTAIGHWSRFYLQQQVVSGPPFQPPFAVVGSVSPPVTALHAVKFVIIIRNEDKEPLVQCLRSILDVDFGSNVKLAIHVIAALQSDMVVAAEAFAVFGITGEDGRFELNSVPVYFSRRLVPVVSRVARYPHAVFVKSFRASVDGTRPFVVTLDGSVKLSPYSYKWLKQCVAFASESPSTIAGCTLASDLHDVVPGNFRGKVSRLEQSDSDVHQLSAFGLLPSAWANFQEWYTTAVTTASHFDPNIVCPREFMRPDAPYTNVWVNSWDCWKAAVLKWMEDSRKSLASPGFTRNHVLVALSRTDPLSSFHGLFVTRNYSRPTLEPMRDDSDILDAVESVRIEKLSSVPSWNLQSRPALPTVKKLLDLDSDTDKLNFARALASEPPHYTGHTATKLTIVMPGYNRRCILVETLNGYCSSIGYLIDQVIVVWNNLDVGPPDMSSIHGCSITVVKPSENSIHNRFTVHKLIRTLAVFSLDDDVRIADWAVKSAFYAWLQDTSRLVGFVVTSRGAWPASKASQLGALRLNAARLNLDNAVFQEFPDDDAPDGNGRETETDVVLDARSARLADVILILEQVGVLTHTPDDNTTYTPDDLEFLEDILKKANATGKLPSLQTATLPVDDGRDPADIYAEEDVWNATEVLQPAVAPSPDSTSSPKPSTSGSSHSQAAKPDTWMYLRCMSFNVTKYTPEGCKTRNNSMNIVLTGGAIFHKVFLELYDNGCGGHSSFAAAKNEVDRAYNGEDLLFSFFHAWLTGKGPWVVGSDRNKLLAAIPGLSKRQDHYVKRAEMLQQFAGIFGNATLHTSQGVVLNNGVFQGVPCPEL